MNYSKRKFLNIIGGGVIVAAGSVATFLSTRTPHSALEPWSQAGAFEDPRKWALSYAILAPNPHNRQPWLVDLSHPDQVIIYRDKTLELQHTDPYSRQLTIGMGCFIELLSIAASQIGLTIRYELFPKGEDGPVAIADFSSGADADSLFDQVMNRRSCKEPYSDQPVTEQTVRQLKPYCDVIVAPEKVEELRRLTWDAWLIEAYTPRTLKESVDLMRFGKAEINANPDGIDLGGPFLESLQLLGLLNRKDQLNINSKGFEQGVEIYREMLAATPAYCVISSPGNSRLDQIQAGRQWLRLNLMTTALNLSLHPISQCLQEYSEMSEHYDRAYQLLAEPGSTLQMLGRLGYGPTVAPTPRWPLQEKIKHG